MEQANDVKRAVRAALRSLEAAQSDPPPEERSKYIEAAIQQLVFAVEKLADLVMVQTKSEPN